MTNLSTPPVSTPPVHPAITAATDSSEKMAWVIADAADDRKAGEIVLIKIGEVSVLADYLVIATGFSNVQVRAIANSIDDQIFAMFGRKARALQGYSEGSWVLADYGDVIAHVMLPDEREYYGLEAFWSHGEVQQFYQNPALG
jgi:ribosome-associated protein